MTTDPNSTENPGPDPVQKYRDTPELSNSAIKYIHNIPLMRMYIDGLLSSENKTYHDVGNAFDVKVADMILRTNNFDKQFIGMECEAPTSENQNRFLEWIKAGKDPVEAYDLSYAAKDKTEKKGPELLAKLTPYLEFSKRAEGKTVLSQSDFKDVTEMFFSMVNHAGVNHLFDKRNKIHSQLPITGVQLFDNPKILWKGLIDFAVQTPEGTIYNIEIKSTRSMAGFMWDYRKYRYHRQQALYRSLLAEHFDVMTSHIKTYVIVTEKSWPYQTKVVEVPEHVLTAGEVELAKVEMALAYNFETGDWSSSEEYDKNNGIESFDWSLAFENDEEPS